MGNFLPSTDAQRREMMDAVGASRIEELYTDIPADLRQRAAEAAAGLPKGVSEFEALEQMKQLAKKNRVFDAIFRGAGAYWHHVPAVVSRVAAKEAFVTAYTPYQPEISQGILQTIFEYQTMLCELTGMDAGNASVYDGATAAAEAAAMCRERSRTVTLLAAGLNPESIETVQTYGFGADTEACIVP
ncbi:MAG: aminomethyl-transferring glycine dehydrogenase, partial [Eubacteriales bacterium]